MPRPLIIICAVGLTPEHIGSNTPALQELANRGFCSPLNTSVPAVTTTAQTTMLTGVDPDKHGIVANGWYFRELGEVWLWRQSQRLLQAPPVWQSIRQNNPDYKVLKHFWWYAMNTDVTTAVTPRPVYFSDGAKAPDFYTWPSELKEEIRRQHGDFPLFQFWGPTASGVSTQWIAESFSTAWNYNKPDLALCYLPHLDYDLQRFGPQGDHLAENLKAIDSYCATVIDHANKHDADILVVSEYGLEAVDHAIPINQTLRQAGLLATTENAAGELLDPGMSRAFAVADHQLAHIYCADQQAIDDAMRTLKACDGIELLLVGADRQQLGLDHPRSGEIVALAAAGNWFLYDYWLDVSKRPDFANNVEIHKKPGYDPRELVFDRHGGKARAGLALLKKKLGMRYRMNPVGLDPSVVKGSHGRPAATAEQGAVIIGSQANWNEDKKDNWHQKDVAALIEKQATCS